MTAAFPYYHLYSNVAVEYALDKNGKLKPKIKPLPEAEQQNDIRQGFVYERVPHITLKSLANDEPPETETLYDKPTKTRSACGSAALSQLKRYKTSNLPRPPT